MCSLQFAPSVKNGVYWIITSNFLYCCKKQNYLFILYGLNWIAACSPWLANKVTSWSAPCFCESFGCIFFPLCAFTSPTLKLLWVAWTSLKTRLTCARSTLTFTHSCTACFVWSTCQPLRIWENDKSESMSVWEGEAGTQKQNSTALIGGTRVPRVDSSSHSFKSTMEKFLSPVCTFESAVTRQCFLCKCPHSSRGPLIDCWNTSNISVLDSTNQ